MLEYYIRLTVICKIIKCNLETGGNSDLVNKHTHASKNDGFRLFLRVMLYQKDKGVTNELLNWLNKSLSLGNSTLFIACKFMCASSHLLVLESVNVALNMSFLQLILLVLIPPVLEGKFNMYSTDLFCEVCVYFSLSGCSTEISISENQNICCGQSFTITCRFGCLGPLNQLFKDEHCQQSSNHGTLFVHVRSATESHSGWYSCRTAQKGYSTVYIKVEGTFFL